MNEEGLAHFLHLMLQIAFFRHYSRVASMRKIFSLLLSICALAVLAKTTLAQELPSGHMVDHLDVIPGDPSYLTIRGFLTNLSSLPFKLNLEIPQVSLRFPYPKPF